MRLGIKSKKAVFLRHLLVAALSALMVYLFYLSYGAWGVEVALWPAWDQDHPFWRAFSHAAFVLLAFALMLGPAAKLWRPVARFVSWRRELGIWFVVLSVAHGYAIWDRWARWDMAALFGFEYVEEVGSYILFRPEVGIMNFMGLMVLPMIVLLAVTSSDKAVDLLGSSWKWLHSALVHAIFYVLMLRGILYLFFFFQFSPPNWRFYPPIWFLYVFLGLGLLVVSLQAAAFAKTVLQRRSRAGQSNPFQVAAIVGVAALFVMPMAIATGTVAYFDSRVIKEMPPQAEQLPQAAQAHAQSFHMVIRDESQDIHLWARDLDSTPYFRQSVEVAGAPVSHQIYRYGGRTLHTAELGADGELVWSTVENVGPEEAGLSQLAAGPATWALQYGPGEHRIELPEGVLNVTIHSVDQAIGVHVFEIVEDANSLPATP